MLKKRQLSLHQVAQTVGITLLHSPAVIREIRQSCSTFILLLFYRFVKRKR